MSISESTSRRNFTLGQSDTALDVRVRTTSINQNGLPSNRTIGSWKLPKGEIHHVVFTYKPERGSVLYVDGVARETFFYEGNTSCQNDQLCGDLSNWNSSYGLILGNEYGGARAWKGNIYLVAFYDRALLKEEVLKNFEARY